MSLKTIVSDFLIIGGGIHGINTARLLSSKFPASKIILFEKEVKLGQHNSTRNSGVIHGGMYYKPGSLKAKLTIEGNELLTNFFKDNKIGIKECGKIIAPVNDEENSRVEEIYKLGLTNGVKNFQMIDSKEALEIEPLLAVNPNYKYLWSPNTKSADQHGYMKFISEDLMKRKNVEIYTNTEFKSVVEEKKESWIIKDKNNLKYEAGKIINCAGLYSNIVAQQFGFSMNTYLLPIKGLYTSDLDYINRGKILKRLIYPMPHKKGNFFLGVHTNFTMDEIGNRLGPTATPVFWRENYQKLDNFKLSEFLDITINIMKTLSWPIGKTLLELAYFEMKKHYSPYIIKECKNLTTIYDGLENNKLGFPSSKKFEKSRAGIIPQLIDKKKKEFVPDFTIEGDNKSIHYLNIVSPGFTCSLSLPQFVLKNYID